MKKVEHGKKTANKNEKTAVHIGEYNKKPMFQIFEVNEQDENTSDYPLLNFGIVKARAVLKHLKELEQFVESQS